jgi:hypothetical protein
VRAHGEGGLTVRARERVSLGAVPWTMNYGGAKPEQFGSRAFPHKLPGYTTYFLHFPTILIYKQILGVARDHISTYALIYIPRLWNRS